MILVQDYGVLNKLLIVIAQQTEIVQKRENTAETKRP